MAIRKPVRELRSKQDSHSSYRAESGGCLALFCRDAKAAKFARRDRVNETASSPSIAAFKRRPSDQWRSKAPYQRANATILDARSWAPLILARPGRHPKQDSHRFPRAVAVLSWIVFARDYSHLQARFRQLGRASARLFRPLWPGRERLLRARSSRDRLTQLRTDNEMSGGVNWRRRHTGATRRELRGSSQFVDRQRIGARWP